MRRLLSPGWLIRHLAMVACVIGLVILGRWQWHRAHESNGTMQNVFYALEWVCFAGFVVFGWWKLLREELHPTPSPGSPPSNHLTADNAAPAAPVVPEEEDDELATYNRYLATLAEQSANPRRSE